MAKTKNSHLALRALCEGAIMVALAQILGYLKLFELPQGGSITVAMVPIIYIAYRAANPNKDCMDMDEFFERMSDDRGEMGNVFMLLFGVREKKQGSVMPSGKPRGKNRAYR